MWINEIFFYLYWEASGFVFASLYMERCWQNMFSTTSEFMRAGIIGFSGKQVLHKAWKLMMHDCRSLKHSNVRNISSFDDCFSFSCLQNWCHSSKWSRMERSCSRRVTWRDVIGIKLRKISISTEVFEINSIVAFIEEGSESELW